MIIDTNKNLCSGCNACASACPKQCIKMKPDSEGFLYPHLNKSDCVHCGICDSVCKTREAGHTRPIRTYAAICDDENIRINSSSGGIFTPFAEWAIEKKGCVFGAAFNEKAELICIGIEEKAELKRLRGSKYVQSRIGNSFIEAKSKLDAGQIVLFTGTPCQIDGLLNFLKKPYRNLFTIDFLCHGVPSPMVWKWYLSFIENTYEDRIDNTATISFRSKTLSKGEYSMIIPLEKLGEYSQVFYNDPYMKLFLENYSLRPSCYHCRSKTLGRNSDLTLGDFWNAENVVPEMCDGKGISLVWINSSKGQYLWNELSSLVIGKEVDVKDTIIKNKAAYQSVNKPWNRDRFFRKVNSIPFDRLVEQTTKISLCEKVYRKIRRMLEDRKNIQV